MKMTTIKEWFLKELFPLLDKVNKILIENGKSKGIDTTYSEWWAIFTKDTITIFEIFEKTNQTRQFAMTIRSLMEFAADISFIAKYPENIKRQQKMIEIFANKGRRLSYQDIALESKKYKLLKYKNGKQMGEVITIDRIRKAFGKKGEVFYYYLNCFSHFNILGIRIDLNIFSDNNSMLTERLLLLQYYPDFFETMTHAMGKICGIEELEKYDCTEIKELFKKTSTNWKLDTP